MSYIYHSCITGVNLLLITSIRHLDPEKRGGSLKNKNSVILRVSAWSKNKEGNRAPWASLLDPPLGSTAGL